MTLELLCIDDGIALKERSDIAKFYMPANRVIGVCSGEFAEYIYAEWKGPPNGEVHGRPVSLKQLRKWGVSIDA